MILFLGAIGKALTSVVGGITKNLPGPLGMIGKAMGGIFDSFSKIGGGKGGMFGAIGGILGGPIGAIAGNILGSIAGKGTPPLPKQFGSMLSRLPQMIQGALKGILGGAGKVFGQQGQGMKKIMGLLQKIMQMLGGKQAPPGPPHGQCGYGAPATGGAGQAPASSGAAAPAASSGSAAPAASSSASSAAPSSSASGASGGDPLMGAAMKTYDQMASTEQEISKLDPNSKDYQKKLMALQQKMQKMNQMIQMLTQMMRMRHDMSMAVIRNIRT